jgi:uncharacterized protein
MRFIAIFCLTLVCAIAQAKEVIPPAPQNHFNDYAHVVSQSTATQLNNQLVQFERDTGNQFVVAIYPKMESDSSVEDYTVRVARAWKVGTKEKNNGVVLFIFIQERKMFIQVGYGLEGALPDALCKRIVSDEIAPHFKQGDYNGGVTAGVRAVIAATKGEYKGTGRTVADQRRRSSDTNVASQTFLFGLFVAVVLILILSRFSRRGFWITPWIGTSGGWSSGDSGGGWSSGGGGSFSGGGGDFGGGGAGGSW